MPERNEMSAKSLNGPTRSATGLASGPACPAPVGRREQVILGHGSGGLLSRRLIEDTFFRAYGNPILEIAEDSAVLNLPESGRLAVTTDSHIVSPMFFPGGDIGRLAVCGTVNDLAMAGAQPLWLTAAFVLEEGLPLETLERVVASMAQAANQAGLPIVAGDTKVARRGEVDGMFITTTGVGRIPPGVEINARQIRTGDAVIVSGTLGDHGIAVLAARGELAFQAQVTSDIAPLNEMVNSLLGSGIPVHSMRDPTRGGLATALSELAAQSGTGIVLEESLIPVDPAVEAACEMLGMDPLYIANEGKLVAIVPEASAEGALATMRCDPQGQKAAVIGRVVEQPAGKVLMKTALGTHRMIEPLAGELLPRIC